MFTYDVYESFQRRQESVVVVAINLEDAYTSVIYTYLVHYLLDCRNNVWMVNWIVGKLRERTVVLSFGLHI